ncbi:MAG: deoxyguanosinetriphosphate triphosphohydrolase [Pseudomonadota bacterium]
MAAGLSSGNKTAFAQCPDDSQGRLHTEPESPTRSPYQRDRDRIVHSAAFRRLQYKTQVFVYHEGDYYRTRLTHSIEVAQIARSISRRLGLNEDLAEGLALAHDLGHTCFGHAGEDALCKAMEDYGGFDHNEQTFRIVTLLERRYAAFDGLNLTWETLEGLVKHNGPLTGARAIESRAKTKVPNTIAAFDRRWPLALEGYASAEAQVAALSDDIAYTNHDIDDGLRAGLFQVQDLLDVPLAGPVFHEILKSHPNLEMQRVIHESVRRLIDKMVNDLLAETGRRLAELSPKTVEDIRKAPDPVVSFSEDMRRGEKELRRFLFQRMYRHYKVNRMTAKAREVVKDVFHHYMAEPTCLPDDWRERAEAMDNPATTGP